MYTIFCFFFQAEDGIRALTVTGVQTCALPIFAVRDYLQRPVMLARRAFIQDDRRAEVARFQVAHEFGIANEIIDTQRSEERRGGKEGRGRWVQNNEKKNRAAV